MMGFGPRATSKYSPDVAQNLLYVASQTYLNVCNLGSTSKEIIMTLSNSQDGNGHRPRVFEELEFMRVLLERRTRQPFTDDMLAGAFVFVAHHHFLQILHSSPDQNEVRACLSVMQFLGVDREGVWEAICSLADYASPDGFNYADSLNDLHGAVGL